MPKLRKPSAKQVEKQTEERVSRVYRQRCANIPIDLMKITDVFQLGRTVVAEGADDQVLGDKLLAFVQAIRVEV